MNRFLPIQATLCFLGTVAQVAVLIVMSSLASVICVSTGTHTNHRRIYAFLFACQVSLATMSNAFLRPRCAFYVFATDWFLVPALRLRVS